LILDFPTSNGSILPDDATVVVGAGAAGLVLALALADRGESVVVLESGDDATQSASAEPDDLNRGVATALPYRGLLQGRARVLGGAAQLWHGQCTRLNEIDMRLRAWVPDSGWPLSLSDLDAHYAAAESWLRVSGRGYDETRWAEHPQLPPVRWNSSHLLHDFTEYAPNHLLGSRYRKRLAEHRSVWLLLRATVGRVVLDADRPIGVEVINPNGRRRHVRAARIVLAAGAVENARLLQLSDPDGIGLGTGRAHIGRYLQDHPVIRTAEVLSTNYEILQDRYVGLLRGGRRLFPKVRLAPEAQERHRLLDANAVFVHDHDDPALEAARRLVLAARSRQWPDRVVSDGLLALRGAKPVARRAYRRFARGLAGGGRPGHVWLEVWVEQAPDAERRISLSAERNHLGLPRAEVHWTCDDREIETSRRLTRWVAEDLKRHGIAELRELPAMHDNDIWRLAVVDAYHPAGTTRMAESPRCGVVDPDLEVHGIPGLFVVGSSVFPTSGYANPTLTIIALALRLADRLRPADRVAA
jgi:choline dehydrogenase-like flavoprotein